MAAPTSQSRRRAQYSLSDSIPDLEEPVNTALTASHLPLTSVDAARAGYRPLSSDEEVEVNKEKDETEAEGDTLVAEVAYFLELVERDEYPYRSHSRKV